MVSMGYGRCLDKRLDKQEHWNSVYAERVSDTLSWFESDPALSLELIARTQVPLDAALIDVGGGNSVLVDCLLRRGYSNLTVLDISTNALAQAQARMGGIAQNIVWINADITQFKPEKNYQLWHDRAVFHFLTRSEERHHYLDALNRGVAPGGHLIMATFALDGPVRCSGLDVERYNAEKMISTLGGSWRLVEQRQQAHRTPAGQAQAFAYFHFFRE